MEDNLTRMMTKTLPANKFNYGWTWLVFHLICCETFRGVVEMYASYTCRGGSVK